MFSGASLAELPEVAGFDQIEVAYYTKGANGPRRVDLGTHKYGGDPGCGGFAGGTNTSVDGTDGAWPEWVADLGSPREGAEYYEQCVHRPKTTARCAS